MCFGWCIPHFLFLTFESFTKELGFLNPLENFDLIDLGQDWRLWNKSTSPYLVSKLQVLSIYLVTDPKDPETRSSQDLVIDLPGSDRLSSTAKLCQGLICSPKRRYNTRKTNSQSLGHLPQASGSSCSPGQVCPPGLPVFWQWWWAFIERQVLFSVQCVYLDSQDSHNTLWERSHVSNKEADAQQS